MRKNHVTSNLKTNNDKNRNVDNAQTGSKSMMNSTHKQVDKAWNNPSVPKSKNIQR